MRVAIPVLGLCLLLAACGGEGDRNAASKATAKKAAAVAAVEGVPAQQTRRFDLAPCFAEDLDDAAAASRCPSFAILQLDYMGRECNAVGGTLRPVAEPVAWSLDVDGDASAEVLMDLAANLDCQGAPGVFSCGSGGCPFFLYGKRDDAWVELGAINADDSPGIEVLPQQGRTPATLRGGCTGMRPCSELTHYEWKGNAYARSWIDFRGTPVDVAPGGLKTLARDAPILDSPAAGAQVLDEYPLGTAVIVIGNARDAPYRFVSPCNACRRGFVEVAALKP